jgi:hypothetical protein
MSEPGKVEERLGIDMSLYHLLRKAGNGLASDILSRECTPADIKSSVAEAGKVLVNHVTVEQEAYSFGVGSSLYFGLNLRHPASERLVVWDYLIDSFDA